MVSKAWVEKTIYWDICRFLQSCLSSSPEFCPGNQIFFPKTWGYEWNTQHGDIGEVGPEFQSNHRFKRCLIPCRYCDRSLPVCKNQIGQIFQNWEKSTPSRASPDGTPSEFSIQEFANTKWCLKPRGWVQVKGALLHLTVELYPKTLSEKYMTQPPKYIDMYQSTDLTAVQCTFWTKLNDRVKPIWVDNCDAFGRKRMLYRSHNSPRKHLIHKVKLFFISLKSKILTSLIGYLSTLLVPQQPWPWRGKSSSPGPTTTNRPEAPWVPPSLFPTTLAARRRALPDQSPTGETARSSLPPAMCQ